MTSCIHAARSVRSGQNRAHAPRRSWFALFALVAVVCGPLVGCGKKGAPLPPLIRVPAASEDFSARRVGDTVYVQFTVPSRNQDNSKPADITAVEVYGYTGTPAGDDDYVKYGTLVASIPVRKPPADNEPKEEKKEPAGRNEPAGKKEPGRRGAGFDQGATITLSEHLGPALLQPVVRPVAKTKPPAAGLKEATIATIAQAMTRFYIVVGRNHKGRRGVFSRAVGVSVAPAPAVPKAVKLTYTESQIAVAWTPPEEATSASVAPPAEGATPPAAPSLGYNVYAAPTPGTAAATPAAATGSAGTESAPVPLNEKPIVGTSFADPRLEFGTERCYFVRTVATSGTVQVESEPSEVACVTPKDTFPPAAPKGLTAVTSAGTINLLWEPNTEPDLNGYLVLRGEAPGGTLQPITAQPVHETTFNDTTVKAGVRYVYAIVGVDKTGNVSAQSNRVEETAR